MRVVIPSVAYGDFLAVTLPAWQDFVPEAEITVVTTPEDAATHAVARACGVTVFATDAWSRLVPVQNTDKAGRPTPRPPVFNKALALDEAFGFFGDRHAHPPLESELCLALDADVLPAGPRWKQADIAAGWLYGAPRYLCATPDQCEAFLAGRTRLEAFPLMSTRMGKREPPTATADGEARKCLGYFQLFRYRPGLRFGSFADASKYDLAFRTQFAGYRRPLGFAVVHLGDRTPGNWQGRTVPPWPQETVCN
jgi:hypothetical protein